MKMANEGWNRWQGLGNLGADPELRITAGGQAVLKLRMACSESYLDKSNTKQEKTEWVSLTMFGKRAEGLAKHLNKGDRLFVEGKLSTSSYDKDGGKRYRTEVIVSDVRFAGGGKGGENRPGSGSRSTEPADDGALGDLPAGDDDIPF